jgi:hypothetical protein
MKPGLLQIMKEIGEETYRIENIKGNDVGNMINTGN